MPKKSKTPVTRTTPPPPPTSKERHVLVSFLRNASWPVSSIYDLLSAEKPSEDDVKLKDFSIDIKPIANDWKDHFLTFGACLPRLYIAILVWHLNHTLDFQQAVGSSSDKWNLLWRLFYRHFLITFGVAVPWDIAFHSLFRPQLQRKKYNQVYSQRFLSDAFWTLCSVIVMSLLELWCWVTVWGPRGASAYPGNGLDTLVGWFWVLSMPYYRIAHFFVIHRAIHPWRRPNADNGILDKVPDVGKFLYTHFHSLHHKAYNPTALSGVRMHPVESFLYYTAALIPVAFGAHPCCGFSYCMIDETVGALLGHDGFGPEEGKGSFPHYLHHAKYEVNYGENLVPLDWLFGTFSDGKSKDA